jgi:hypothetical protein
MRLADGGQCLPHFAGRPAVHNVGLEVVVHMGENSSCCIVLGIFCQLVLILALALVLLDWYLAARCCTVYFEWLHSLPAFVLDHYIFGGQRPWMITFRVVQLLDGELIACRCHSRSAVNMR